KLVGQKRPAPRAPERKARPADTWCVTKPEIEKAEDDDAAEKHGEQSQSDGLSSDGAADLQDLLQVVRTDLRSNVVLEASLQGRRERKGPDDVAAVAGGDDRTASVLGGHRSLDLSLARPAREVDGELRAAREVDAQLETAVGHEKDAGDDDQEREQEVPGAVPEEVDLSNARRGRRCLDFRDHCPHLRGGGRGGPFFALLLVR